MSIKGIRTCIGSRVAVLMLFVGISAAAFTLASGLFAQHAYAFDGNNIKSVTWDGPWTVVVADGKGEVAIFRENPLSSPTLATDDRGDFPSGTDNAIRFWGESLQSYLNRNPNDKGICSDSSYPNGSIGYIDVPNPAKQGGDFTNYKAGQLFHGVKEGGGDGRCTSLGNDASFSSVRPATPDSSSVAKDDKNNIVSATWTSPYSIKYLGPTTIYVADPTNSVQKIPITLSDLGVEKDQTFLVDSIDGNRMTLKAATNPPTCAGLSPIRIIIDSFNDPFLASYAGQLLIPYPYSKDAQQSCSQYITTWIQINNAHPTAPQTSSVTTVTWQTKDKDSISIDKDTFAVSAGIKAGAIFTKPTISDNKMSFSQPAVCGSSSNVIEIDPYRVSPYAHLVIYGYKEGSFRCSLVFNGNVDITNPDTPGITSAGTNNGSTTDVTDQFTCPVTGGGLEWVLCPIFNLATQAEAAMNNILAASLYFPTDQIFGTAASKDYLNCTTDTKGVPTCVNTQPVSLKTAFDSFRNIAMALLVIAGIFMVASQAAGLEVFAAYTVRKALPRLVIAAIGIALAWPVLEFVVVFFNDLGSWVSSLILTAVHVSDGASLGAPTTIIGGVVDTVLAGGTLIALGFTGIIGLTLIGTVLLALLVALVVLAMRQLVILVCIIAAPLAIACAIFPGTQKIWQLWKDALVGALMMFPIIMGFLAAGAALGSILGAAGAAADANGSTGASSQVLSILAVVVSIAPYLLIGKIITITSGVMGAISSGIMGLANGGFSGLSRIRQTQATEARRQLLAGGRFNPDSPWTNRRGLFIGRAVNWAGGHLGAGLRGNLGFGATGEAARGNNMTMSPDDAARTIPHFGAMRNDAEAMMAVSLGNDAARMRQYAQFQQRAGETQQQWDARIEGVLARSRLIQATPQAQTAAAMAVAADGSMLRDSAEADQYVRDVSHGNESFRRSFDAAFRVASKAGGRQDLRRAFTQDDLTRLGLAGTINPLTGQAYAAGDMDAYAALSEMNVADIRSQRPESMRELFSPEAIDAALNDPRTVGNPARRQQIINMAHAARNSDNITSAQREAIDTLFTATVGGAGLPVITPPEEQAAMDWYRNSRIGM